MSFPRQVTRVDAKLGLILVQLHRVRGRLNSLAWQQIVFMSLAAAIAGGAAVMAAAYLLNPLPFLIAALLAALLAAAALVRGVVGGWRMRASAARAAAIADQRADLKGRLETVVALARNPHPGPLWPYLVEDTLERHAEFAPARVERRRISRALFAFAAALLLAALVYPLSKMARPRQLARNDAEADLNMDLDDLHLRPAEPGEETDLTVNADPDTIAKIEAKAAREGAGHGAASAGSAGGLMNQARSLAGKFQHKLTGQHSPNPHVTLHLSDSGDQYASNNIRGSKRNPESPTRHGEAAGQFKHEKLSSEERPLPPMDALPSREQPEDQPDPNAQPAGDSNASGNAPDKENESSASASASARGERSSNGGSSHGIGADPDTLFGAPINSKLGGEGFEISIEARPMDKGSKAAGHAYVPPRVKAPLNASQQPDEPVARAEVPPQDQATIKRVFDR